MNVTIEHLRCFKTAAETLNFTAAAQKYHIAQPAMSRILASLEQEWNVRLFERSTRRTRLTPEGELCLAHVNKILREYDRLLDDNINGTKELSVGFNSATGPAPWLITALRQFKDEFPQVVIHLSQLTSRDAVFKIQSRDLDCAVIFEHSAQLVEGLSTTRLAPLYRHVIVPRYDPLSKKSTISLSDLDGRHLLFLKSIEEFTYSQIHRQLEIHNVKPRGETLVDQLAEMMLQAELGGGIGITGHVSQYDSEANISFLPLERFEDEEDSNFAAFAWREDDNNILIAALRSILVRNAKDI